MSASSRPSCWAPLSMSAVMASALARMPSSSWAICAWAASARSSIERVASSTLLTCSAAWASARARVSLASRSAPSRTRLASRSACCFDLAGAALGGLDDGADLLGSGAGDAPVGRPFGGGAAEVLDGVGDLAEVRVYLVGVVTTTGSGEVLTGDVSAFELHGREAYRGIGQECGRLRDWPC